MRPAIMCTTTLLALAIAAAPAGCGGSELPVLQNVGELNPDEGDNKDGGDIDAGPAPFDASDAASDTDASDPGAGDAGIACGKGRCDATQYCLHPCCGGAAPQCIAKPASGVCPAGFHPAFCNGGGGEGCEQDPCTPPPPTCIDNPGSVGGSCVLDQNTRHLSCICA